MSARLFARRVKLIVYFDQEELAQLQAYTRQNCMSLSQWVRRITLHVAAKQGILTKGQS